MEVKDELNGVDAARKAKQDAQRKRQRIEESWPMIREIVSNLRITREKNHFSERIAASLRGEI